MGSAGERLIGADGRGEGEAGLQAEVELNGGVAGAEGAFVAGESGEAGELVGGQEGKLSEEAEIEADEKEARGGVSEIGSEAIKGQKGVKIAAGDGAGMDASDGENLGGNLAGGGIGKDGAAVVGRELGERDKGEQE